MHLHLGFPRAICFAPGFAEVVELPSESVQLAESMLSADHEVIGVLVGNVSGDAWGCQP